jgi:murein DD-endopeptidase MepM/ murein hydrolase activator NlpD
MFKLIKKNIIKVTVLLTSFLVVSVLCFYNEEEIQPDMRDYFSGEEEYFDYLKNEVRFQSVKFSFVEIERGDNYWTMARDHDSNIDSLIGVNIFWEDLLARVGKTVAVPSERGVLVFVTDYSHIKTLAEEYRADEDDIEVQQKPLFYSLYYKFIDDRKPIALFIKNVKPRTENMTSTLASSFELREMFRSPLGGRLSSFFGNRRHPVYSKRRFHNGLDIAARHGTWVGASRAGRVIFTGWNGGYGKSIIIEHDKGYKTLYGHLSQIKVRQGQKVSAGKIIGRVGSTGLSTGPHLHFTLWHNGKLINPMDVLW